MLRKHALAAISTHPKNLQFCIKYDIIPNVLRPEQTNPIYQ